MTNLSGERFAVVYKISASSYEEAKKIAWGIQVEQTIEFPYELLYNERIKSEIVGRLEELSPCDEGFRARISYAVECTALEVSQFLNVVFGNSSLQPGIWVEDIELSPTLIQTFQGPHFGLQGLRAMLDVPERPMMQAVVKPMGTSAKTLAAMCHAYTLGGADVIKDDHGLSNQVFSNFKERVSRCAEAVAEAKLRTGKNTLYAPNVTADGPDVLERAYQAKEAGATALLYTPGLAGFGWLNVLAKDANLGLPIISHPAFMGTCVLPGMSGVAQHVWMGLLPRLFGADMGIFVSYGGRFTFTPEQCRRIIQSMTEPCGDLKAICPSPGGGVTAARLPELKRIYGSDVMYLVGGDMFRRGADLEDNMKYFISLLEAK